SASLIEQSLLELTDKETREKLSHWDRRGDPMAPLTEKQTDSVLEIRAAAEVALLPAEVSAVMLASKRQLTANSTNTLLSFPHTRCRLTQKLMFDQMNCAFLRRKTRDVLSVCQEQCDSILSDVNAALERLDSLQKQYLFVSTKTGTLHEACEQLLKEQSELVDLAESIQQKLSYFNELENINTKLNSPTLSVNSEGFIPMLSKLDECIEYVSSHPHFKDYPVYLTKFRQCLSRAMLLIKSHTVSSLQNLTAQLTKRDPLGAPNADNAFTLYYVKFRAAAPKVRRLIEQVEQRSNKIPEYQQLLDEIHQCYLEQREVLLSPCINATITDLTSQNNKMTNSYINDLWQIGTNVMKISYMKQILEQLFYSEVCLTDLFKNVSPECILEFLSETSFIAFWFVSEVQLAAFDAVVKQMLEDVQERLVYRTHIYIQTDILGYKPAPGDLAYPDKLEMMEKIAQSLKEEQMKLTSSSSFSDVQLEESDNKKLVSSGECLSGHNPRAHSTVSPADLHGMWYPTVRRTLVCLSKLYRCIDRAVFQGLSQEALSACIQSLLKASDIIQKNKNQIDGQLFLIKHLLIMREQIAPFHADFAIKEISLDLKKTRGNSHAFLAIRLDSISIILDIYISVDRHLKSSCEQFIQQQTHMFVGNLEEFLTKVRIHLEILTPAPKPTANVFSVLLAKINDIVMATYRILKTKLPITLQSLSLYLANKDTEFILFKPVRNNVQQVFQRLHALLQKEYSGEDLQIIACPSMEQVLITPR
uniref:Conserved oligomeric Golgi complex subunit 3 n=1 Tax=Sinocyclocheilus rhinocerous TaxID=307959 RepID=A0A673K7I7_9TELE